MLDRDDKAIYLFAFRYAIERRTYSFGLVADKIMSNIDDFQNWEISLFIEESKEALTINKNMDKCDADNVKALMSKLEKEMKQRIDNGYVHSNYSKSHPEE